MPLPHCQDKFVFGASHVNGIESFWNFVKSRLQQFRGVPKHPFLLHCKEPEFLFSHRHVDFYRLSL